MILAAGITAPRAQAYRFRLRAGEFTWEITRRYSEFADLERARSHLATERYRPCLSVLGDWHAFFLAALFQKAGREVRQAAARIPEAASEGFTCSNLPMVLGSRRANMVLAGPQ